MTRQPVRPLVYALLFLSGAAGLVYQVVWSRLLNEVFGVSAHAVTAVLATYLGGLALGAWVLGRVADRPAGHPLRLYGWLEIGVGSAALLGTSTIGVLDPLHLWVASRLAPSSPALLAVRMALASAVVLPATFLMGGTLAVVARVFVTRVTNLGRELSLLYAVNTSGAVAGCLLTGFVLIRAVGVHPTLSLAVAANVVVGALALLLSRTVDPLVREGAASPATATTRGDVRDTPGASRTGFWLLVAVALSGFASLSLEVVWTRMLVLVAGTSTYAFVTMLAAFLVGIALGGFVAQLFVDRLSHPRHAFGWVQLAVAASTLATIPLIRFVLLHGQRWLEDGEGGWMTVIASRFGAAFLVMVVPTTLIGTTFPLASRIWARSVDTLGRRVGQVYGANTLGNILGALGGGFLVLPLLGMQKGTAVLATLNIAAACWGLAPSRVADRRVGARTIVRIVPLGAALSACVVLLLAWRPDPLPGTGGSAWDPVLYYREGLVSTVKVIQRADDGRQRLMVVDGVTIGQSSTGVDKKQQVLAHLPFALAPDGAIRRVLTIGLGTGILDGAVARHPGVASIDCVEISPSVIEAARLFGADNGNVLADPRVRLIADDGVSFLRRSRTAYDAIVSDGKSRSGHAGNALFYSEEYYRIALDHLGADGLMIQWVPLDVTPADFRIILRTFVSVFPRAYVWLGDESVFLVGRRAKLVLDLDHVERVLPRPEFAGLRRHGWRGAAEVASLLIADATSLTHWLADERTINSLARPVLEFYPPAALATPAPVRVTENLAALATVWEAGLHEVHFVGAGTRSLDANVRAVGRLLAGLARMRDPASALPMLESALAAAPEHGVIRELASGAFFTVGYALDTRGELGAAESLYVRASSAWPPFTEAYINLGRVLAREGRRAEAVARFADARRANPESGLAHRLLAQLLLATGDPGAAIPHLRDAVRLAPAAADLHADLGASLAMVGQVDQGVRELRRALGLEPASPLAMSRLALLLATHPDARARNVGDAIRLSSRAVKLTAGRDPTALEVLAASYAAAGRFDEAARTERGVVDLAIATNDADLAASARATVDLYQRGLPLPANVPGGRRSNAL